MSVERPTTLVVTQYVEKRIAQVADLLQMVDNSKLVSGEVTKGPRTAAQRLPRHMRRRAMGYNVKRMPRSMREFAAPFLANSKHRKKPPSRFARRRPKNLLLNYIRRQREKVWLETHIWHAKRFYMMDAWGYRLPDRSFQRNFRPVYRASMRHCAVRDHSYLCCLQVSCASQSDLIARLAPLFSAEASATPAFKSALDGRYEVSAQMFRAREYPRGFIAPVRLQWSRGQTGTYQLQLWTHPASYAEVREQLVSILRLEKKDVKKEEEEDRDVKMEVEEEKGEDGEKKGIPRSAAEWRLRRCELQTEEYKSADGKVEMLDLRDQLVRVRLFGARSLAVAAAALRTVRGDGEGEWGANHSEWRSGGVVGEASGAHQLPDGTVLSLLVEDPRLAKPVKRTSPEWRAACADPVDAAALAPVRHELWQREARLSALRTRLTDAELNKRRGERVATVEETECKIPVQVIVRNAPGGATPLCGLEIIAPAGFGMDVWVQLQLRTARASGVRDQLAAQLEAGVPAWPADALDGRGGSEEMEKWARSKEDKELSRPHNKRVRFWGKLSVKHPHRVQATELVRDWAGGDAKEPYVLRDRRGLIRLEKWLRGCGERPADVLSAHPHALLPVKVDMLARGHPKRMALLCLPTAEDWEKIAGRHANGPSMIKQVPREKEEEEEGEKMEQEEEREGEKKSKDEVRADKVKEMWKDKVSFGQENREKAISLKDMFPDRVMERMLKRKAVNRGKRQAIKKRKLVAGERAAAAQSEAEEKAAVKYRMSSNREVCGRVVRGDFSFCAAAGKGLGFVPLAALDSIIQSGRSGKGRGQLPIVLVRNATSKYYHPARLEVNRRQTEI